jgi:thiamine biosynthesis protein ThiS
MKIIKLNGKETALVEPGLLAVLDRAGISASQRGMAIAINRKVVRRREWAKTELVAGDEVEVVQPLSGG